MIKFCSGYRTFGLTPNDLIALGGDAADAPAVRLMFKPALGPEGWETHHQFKILATVQAPLIPELASGPAFRSRKPVMGELSSALTAVAKSLHRRQETVTAIRAGGSPGQVLWFVLEQRGQGIQPGSGPAMLADGLLLKSFRQCTGAIQTRITLKQC